MFLLKKVMEALLTPPGLLVVLMVAGLVRLGRGGGRALLATSAILLYLMSIGPGANLLVAPLESRYPPLADPKDVRASAVVVLGAGGEAVLNAPPQAGLNGASLARLTEGVRLWRQLGGRPRLVLSGGSPKGGVPVARLMAETAEGCLGVPKGRLVLEEKSLDTGESARLLAPMLAGQRFILVTSACHLPRAVADFRAQGLVPLPAPTDYLRSGRRFSLYSLLPTGANLHASSLACHEYLGLSWQRAAALLGRPN